MPMPNRHPAALLLLSLSLIACPGGDSSAEDPAEVVARVDSLERVVADLRSALEAARSAPPTSQAEASAAAAVASAAEEADRPRTTDGAEPFRGPVAEELSTSLFRFPGERGATITYVGAVKDGKAHGLGYGVWTTGSAYQGEWRDNRRNGSGRHQYPDGAVYEGLYVDDRREGEGTYYYKNGQRWEGPWKDNLRHGEGVLYEADGKVRVRGIWERDRLVREIKP